MKTSAIASRCFLAALLLAGCAPNTGGQSSAGGQSASGGGAQTASADAKAGTGGTAIGFIFVGARDDYGYNQAAYQGSVAVEKAFPKMKILRAENVPETAEAERVMEDMIRSGARIIFPTSYGHLDPALEVAKRHPEVVFFHQGGLKTAPNLGTYFGTIWEPVYLAGIAAAKMSKTGKLGYIVSVPIPQVLLNVNAFEMGARSVNPKVTTNVVFTGSWCDPGQQANGSNSLLDQGVDVITQHQDCTKTVIESAKRRGIMTVGYHADASPLAPQSWIAGAVWNWPKLFVDMAKTANEGKFAGSRYDGRFRGRLKDDVVELTPFGPSVPADVRQLVEAKKKALIAGTLQPFKGPVRDQKGQVRIPAGDPLPLEKLEAMDYLVEGVVGNIPAG